MESQEHQNKGEGKLNTVLNSLRNLQDEKGSLEAKLGQKQAALQAHVSFSNPNSEASILRNFFRWKLYNKKRMKSTQCGKRLSAWN